MDSLSIIKIARTKLKGHLRVHVLIGKKRKVVHCGQSVKVDNDSFYLKEIKLSEEEGVEYACFESESTKEQIIFE